MGISAVWRFLLRQYAFIFCLFLHLVIVAAHAVLIWVVVYRDQRITDVALDIDVIFVAIIMAPGLIIKTYLVIMLVFTQSLALKRNYHIQQSLTALHEKSAAWLGLGSAISGLWRSHSYRGARWSMLLILLYFVCLFALGITTPALINVGFTTDGGSQFSLLTSYLAQVTRDGLVQAFPVISVLPLIQYAMLAIGFQDSTIYDIPNVAGSGQTSVDVVTFQATCHYISGIHQAGTPSNTSVAGSPARLVTFPFFVGPGLRNVNVTPAAGTLNILSARPVNDQAAMPPTLIVAATGIQVVDSVDTPSVLSTSPISPEVTPDPATCGTWPGNCAPIAQIQVIACDIQAFNQSEQIDLETGDLETASSVPPMGWTPWSVPDAPSSSYLAPVGDFGALSPPSNQMQTFNLDLGDGPITTSFNSTLLEASVLDYLRMTYLGPSDTTITLGQLGDALARAVSLVYWRASSQLALGAMMNQPYVPGITGLQVQVNKYTPWMGLGISTVLLILAIVLTRQPLASPRELDSIGPPGILQLAWLMGRVPHLAEKLASDVNNPDNGALLSAGAQIQVHMRDHMKASRKKESEEALEQVPDLPEATSAATTPGEEKNLADVV